MSLKMKQPNLKCLHVKSLYIAIGVTPLYMFYVAVWQIFVQVTAGVGISIVRVLQISTSIF
jgi:hypothetical protein